MNKIPLIMALYVLTSGIANAQETSLPGTITTVRYHTAEHPVLPARSHTIFGLDSGGCTWYWLAPSEITESTIVAKAKIDALPVTIRYDPSEKAPWGDPNACRVTAIDLN